MELSNFFKKFSPESTNALIQPFPWLVWKSRKELGETKSEETVQMVPRWAPSPVINGVK